MATDDKKNTPVAPLQKNLPSLDHPLHIEPLFWGTGDLLVWESTQLLQAIDRDHLFRKIWARNSLADEEYARVCKGVFEPVFNELYELIIRQNLIDPRSFYGFFPVITDADTLILLDPADFHTELLTLTYHQTEEFAGYSFSSFFRPEGDVIGVSAVTIGKNLERVIHEQVSEGDTGKKGYFLQGIASTVIDLLITKIATEMRRSLGIPENAGKVFPFITHTYCNPVLKELIEITAIEERLGICLENGMVLNPVFSSINCFVHHPALKNLV